MDEGMNFSMPVTPGYGNNSGFGFGGDWAWIILLLVLCGGWGNGFGGGFGGGDIYPWMNQSNQISDGFRDQLLGSQISGIQNSITSGFGDVQTALCGGFAGVNAAITNASINDMQNTFALQNSLSNCCCENRLATVQTQNIVQSEGALTRAAIQSQTQAILDKMCQDKIDAKNEEILKLNNRINFLEENNYVQNALTAQTQYLINQLGTAAAPAA